VLLDLGVQLAPSALGCRSPGTAGVQETAMIKMTVRPGGSAG
jgi:hypothetical protein